MTDIYLSMKYGEEVRPDDLIELITIVAGLDQYEQEGMFGGDYGDEITDTITQYVKKYWKYFPQTKRHGDGFVCQKDGTTYVLTMGPFGWNGIRI